MIGTIINGKYAVDRRLGGGGMAEVFAGRTVGAEGFARPVAIKRVLDGYSQDQLFADMFISEAQLTSRLQHPNVVSVLDFIRDQGSLFLVMELVDGTDLSGLLETGPLPLPVVMYLTAEILRGLDYAHELPLGNDGVRGLVHRDISPHNVLLGWTGAVKISDFGIAKARARTAATASVMIKGKPAYMSPEQANGEPLDGRSDLFAVGVMMFEMICLQPLFCGDTNQATLFQVFSVPIPNVRDLRKDCPKDLATVVSGLLTRDLAHRTPTAAAAAAALIDCADYPRDGREQLVAILAERFAGRAPVRARSVPHISAVDATLVPRVPIPVVRQWRTGTTPTPTSLRYQRNQNNDRRWKWLVATALIVSVAVVGALVVTQRGQGGAATPRKADAPSISPSAPAATITGGRAPAVPPPAPPAATAAPGSAGVVGGGVPARSTAGAGSAQPSRTDPPDAATAKPPVRRPSDAAKPGGIRELHL